MPFPTPNQITLLGLPLGLLGGFFLSRGAFLPAAFTVILLGGCDVLDGYLARKKGYTSPFGAFLDSTVDRITELFLFMGILFFYLKNGNFLMAGMAYWVIGGSLVVSCARARAENLIEGCRVGFWERPERMVLLLLGLLFGRLKIALWILAFGVALTACHRILHTRNVLAGRPPFTPLQKGLLWDYPRASWPYRLLALLIVALLLSLP